MDKSIQGMVLFCEDVRNEVGGSSTYVGVMGSEVDVVSKEAFRLTCVISFWAAKAKVYSVSGSIEIDGAAEGHDQPRPLETEFDVDQEQAGSLVSIVARLRPFDIERESARVKVRVTIDEIDLSGMFVVHYREPISDKNSAEEQE